MKKVTFLIILLNVSLLFGYDLRGYWGLNVLTPENMKYKHESLANPYI